MEKSRVWAVMITLTLLTATGIGGVSDARGQTIKTGLYNHVLTLKPDGSLWGWGNNERGQLGVDPVSTLDPLYKAPGTQKSLRYIPILSQAGPWLTVSAGGNFSAGIKQNGTLWVWGDNSSGQLGTAHNTVLYTGTYTGVPAKNFSFAPVQIGVAANWTAVAAGTNHLLALNSLGELWTLGRGHNGELAQDPALLAGTNSIGEKYSTTLAQIPAFPASISAIAAGEAVSGVVLSNGNIYVWGSNAFGQLGNNNGYLDTFTPQLISPPALTTWASLSFGGRHTVAGTASGEIYVWGDNSFGQLGLDSTALGLRPTTLDSAVPVKVGTDTDWSGASTGYFHTLAKKSAGTIFGWGDNSFGQSGDIRLFSALSNPLAPGDPNYDITFPHLQFNAPTQIPQTSAPLYGNTYSLTGGGWEYSTFTDAAGKIWSMGSAGAAPSNLGELGTGSFPVPAPKVLANVAMNRNGDIVKDGNIDILWRHDGTGQNAVWTMNGTTRTGALFLTSLPDPAWKIAGTADFNNDGNTDILWRNDSTGQNAVWLMNGTLRASFQYLTTLGDPAWKIVGAADFNNDGKPDILWRYTTTGQNAVWLMNGTVRTSFQYLTTVADPAWEIAGTGDFNKDGNVDILWRHATTGQNAVWFMNGTTRTGAQLLTTLADPAWKIAATGDFNSDGNTDILWRHDSTGQNAVWLMNGTTRTGSQFLITVADPAWKIVGPK